MDRERESFVQGRRGFLRGIATLPLAGALPAAAVPPDPADDAFRRWITSVGDYNAGRTPERDPDDDDCPVQRAYLEDPEEAIMLLPPSIMKAGAIAIVELSYFLCFTEQPKGPMVLMLEALRTSLSGAIGRVAADIVDMAEGATYADLLLGRLIKGKEATTWA